TAPLGDVQEEPHLHPPGKHEDASCSCSLTFPTFRAESSAACEVCEGAEEMTEPLKQCTAWLHAYFCEPARVASLPVPAFHHPLLRRDSFTRQVLWTLLRDVKFGEAVSYKQLAVLAGNSRAARAVGGAMRSNPIPILIPCHRVICSSGQSGNYGGGNLMKEWLLSHEKLQKEKLVQASPRGGSWLVPASLSPGSPLAASVPETVFDVVVVNRS
uniref:Methylated-DNA--protein-cysteine methyltransferase n=1 Tax=Accipiter nisus TaxID=211598 RepID=A0A8B9M207_9AVES